MGTESPGFLVAGAVRGCSEADRDGGSVFSGGGARARPLPGQIGTEGPGFAGWTTDITENAGSGSGFDGNGELRRKESRETRTPRPVPTAGQRISQKTRTQGPAPQGSGVSGDQEPEAAYLVTARAAEADRDAASGFVLTAALRGRSATR